GAGVGRHAGGERRVRRVRAGAAAGTGTGAAAAVVVVAVAGLARPAGQEHDRKRESAELDPGHVRSLHHVASRRHGITKHVFVVSTWKFAESVCRSAWKMSMRYSWSLLMPSAAALASRSTLPVSAGCNPPRSMARCSLMNSQRSSSPVKVKT